MVVVSPSDGRHWAGLARAHPDGATAHERSARGLARFVDQMARRVDGRVVAPELDDLGAAVVDSYLGSRRPGWAPDVWGWEA